MAKSRLSAFSEYGLWYHPSDQFLFSLLKIYKNLIILLHYPFIYNYNDSIFLACSYYVGVLNC